MKKIVIATKNKGKIREMTEAFAGLPVEVVALSDFGPLPDAVEDGATFRENALIKARFYAEKTGCACVADDSGLEIEALGNAPGVYSARYAGYHADDNANNEYMVKEMKRMGCSESPAAYRCVLAYVDGSQEITTDGSCHGTIRLKPQGNGGFGYDPYFYIDANKTLAQITFAEKDKISHRGEALRKLVAQLEGMLK